MRVSIGCVPIVWNNVDLPDLGPPVPHAMILDELARLGYQGCQQGRGFPTGDELRAALEQRGLRLAEWYCALEADASGLVDGAEEVARATLDHLVASGGEVLVVAIDGSPERDPWCGRVSSGAPRWDGPAYDRLARLLGDLATAAPDGVRIAFHPHAATWIEAPDEVDAIAAQLPATGAGLCLDVGHYLVGGGDPVEAIRRHGSLITHVHAKDVDLAVLSRLRSGDLVGFNDALRGRVFTELGNGALDLGGMAEALESIGYVGWLMVEQDSSWMPPADAAEIGRRALRRALAALDA
ncbi:MAG: sugar phosphate isomerase/epimerase [Candidatus Limnocylindria bacterium]